MESDSMRKSIGTFFAVTSYSLAASADVISKLPERADTHFRAAPTVAKSPSFMGLGYLPGCFSSSALSISADGSTVVGFSRFGSNYVDVEAFRWTRDGGMLGLGDFPGGDYGSVAFGTSGEGRFVVGYGISSLGPEAFLWSSDTGMVGLGYLPGGINFSVAKAVSADGSVVVGESDAPGGGAFRWTSADGIISLGRVPGVITSDIANAVSADGAVIVGNGYTSGSTQAFRWTEGGGLVGLGDLPGGSFRSTALDTSSDGSIVVGWSSSELAFFGEAYRWTSSSGMVGLGALPSDTPSSKAYGISGDGSVIVGVSSSVPYQDAFVWDPMNGMRSLRSILTHDLGLDLTGWTLEEARDVSDDGLTIVGWGINPAGITEAWVAHIPEPTMALPLFLAALLARRTRRP
jgi:probable HAF family extracellular repeat protein